MRPLAPFLLALVLAGCERFEAPSREALARAEADVAVITPPGGEPLRFIRARIPRDTGPQPAVWQGGRLIVRDGCMLLYTGEVEPPAVIIWPREAALDLGVLGVTAIADRGGRVRVGELMTVTGLPGPGRLPPRVAGPCAGRPTHALQGFEPLSEAEFRASHQGAEPPTPPMQVPAAPPPPADYVAKGAWRVTKLAGVTPIDPGSVVIFRPTGMVSAYAGCNHYEASLAVRGGRLVQPDPERGPLSTMAGCSPAQRVQEDALFSILRPGGSVVATGTELVITDALGREVRLAPGGREPRGDG